MNTTAPIGTPTPAPTHSGRKRPFSERLAAVLVGVMLVAWIVHLWPQWTRNPDLSHGLFAPLVFIALLHEARTRGAPRYLSPSATLTAGIGFLGITGLTLLVGGGLYAAALEWNHALVEFLLAGALCAFLTAAWLTAALDGVRAIPLNWPAAVSILIWALSAPIPPGTYTRLTQGLQAAVTESVLVTLQVIGVAAFRDGNVINLAHTSVGVEEACSGVRSLLSCIFAGFFLSAILVRSPWKRCVIIAFSAPLAIAMNFFRSLTLTLLANSGVDIHGAWHDLTGFAVLGVTALLLAGLARILERSATAPCPARSTVEMGAFRGSEGRGAARAARSLLVGTLTVSIALLAVFILATRPAPVNHEKPPDLLALLPARADGWTVSTRDDLYHFSSQLQTDFLAERTYRREDDRGRTQITVYVAYWPAGQASVSLVASHTPDACWPGSGWVEDAGRHGTASLRVGEIQLPEAQHRLFRLVDYPQHVWYWHLVGGEPFKEEVGSPGQLLSLAWHYGFRNDEKQIFARISSNRPWREISGEPLLRQVVSQLHQVGL